MESIDLGSANEWVNIRSLAVTDYHVWITESRTTIEAEEEYRDWLSSPSTDRSIVEVLSKESVCHTPIVHLSGFCTSSVHFQALEAALSLFEHQLVTFRNLQSHALPSISLGLGNNSWAIRGTARVEIEMWREPALAVSSPHSSYWPKGDFDFGYSWIQFVSGSTVIEAIGDSDLALGLNNLGWKAKGSRLPVFLGSSSLHPLG